jgi:hypothetical protein
VRVIQEPPEVGHLVARVAHAGRRHAAARARAVIRARACDPREARLHLPPRERVRTEAGLQDNRRAAGAGAVREQAAAAADRHLPAGRAAGIPGDGPWRAARLAHGRTGRETAQRRRENPPTVVDELEVRGSIARLYAVERPSTPD